jgi:DNA-binding CsgD family transcriptional regulator/GAF domain-containing protein
MNRFTGCLDAEAIATCVSQGLIQQFGCAFARIWLVERDRTALQLVASSGLYTRLDGSFARVLMGSFKVGKIAQHCIPFLSNALPDEDWVKDRAWAIENQLQGFAGLPLMAEGQAIGVLAVFSHQAMAPEFLEVLQMLSLSISGALASALNHQAIIQSIDSRSASGLITLEPPLSLSEQLATILGHQKLSLLGVEQPLNSEISQLLIKVANGLANVSCHYCRLMYETETVVLEAMLAADIVETLNQLLLDLVIDTEKLGGLFQTQIDLNQTVVEVRIQLPIQLPNEQAKIAPRSPLSAREQEVMILLAGGARDRDISEQLFISERTVKFHTKNMLNKLGVKTRIQAVFEATKQGWL